MRDTRKLSRRQCACVGRSAAGNGSVCVCMRVCKAATRRDGDCAALSASSTRVIFVAVVVIFFVFVFFFAFYVVVVHVLWL